ncbi:MAG: hypothetical protein DRP20_02735 [Thermotogae bacterium]|nr:MAG: hypothetical protein DRP20_02735 [Thermotogota bacterium]
MEYTRYIVALEKAMMKLIERGFNVIDVDELWLETSIPIDLIVEIVKKRQIKFPENLQVLRLQKQILWKKG